MMFVFFSRCFFVDLVACLWIFSRLLFLGVLYVDP